MKGVTARPEFHVALALALAIGALLRFAHLDQQLLIGDELHAVEAAVEWSASEIVRKWVHRGADYSIPLTLLYRFAIDAGATLSESTLRAPILAFGLGLIALLPLWLRRRIGDRAAALLAVLIALSPLLALYSRIVRSYAPAVFLSIAAVLFFERWMRERRRRDAASYGVFAALSIWFNLTTLPLVAAPMLYAGARTALGGASRREWIPLLAVGLFASACVAAVVLPALDSLLAMRGIHGRGGIPTFGTWTEVARMHSGTRNVLCTLVVLAFTARGMKLLWRRDREFALYLGSISLLHVVGLVLIGPSQLDNPIVINRYLLPLLPLGLCCLALGLCEPLPRIAGVAQATGVVALLAAVFATGPFVDPAFRYSSFVNAPTFTYFVRDGNWVPAEVVPRFYRDAAEQSDRPIIEYPWFNVASNAFDAYQKVHRRPLLVGAPAQVLQDPPLALRRVLKPTMARYLESDAQWLVVHIDMQAEERRVHTSNRNHWMWLELLPDVWQTLGHAGRETAQHLERRWGPPDRTEDGLRIWNLDRLRTRERRRSG